MAFGEHLSPYQNVHAFPPDIILHSVPGMFAPCTIAIDAKNARIGKAFTQRLFEALRTLPQTLQILVAARRAGGWQPLLVSAIMAAHNGVMNMPDQARAASNA